MRLIIDDTARFFTVAGSPSIAECHAVGAIPHRGPQQNSCDRATKSSPCATGSWLNDDR
jgi:hypothetical protein